MPGVTKHIFNHEICDILSMFNCEIKTIEPLLPKEYSSDDIIALLKEFYPHEWHSVEVKYVYYQTKDRYIKRKFGKNRYNMKAPEVLSVKVSTGSAQIKGRTEPALPTSKFSGQSGRMAKTVRQNQAQLGLAFQGNEQPALQPWQAAFLSDARAYLPDKGQRDSILPG